MPRAVYILGLGVFALGTTEFMISGLLPDIARDLKVSVPEVGMLISAFAMGMIIGAPVMAVLTLRWPKKLTLLVSLAVFTAGQIVGALAPDYATLLVARVVTAVATGAFWAVGSVVAVTLSGPTAKGRALAIMVGGLTLANVFGVPLGTLISTHGGWRLTFWAVAATSILAAVGVYLMIPRTVQGSVSRPNLQAELAAFRGPKMWAALSTTALTSAAVFGTFSYLAPLLSDVAGYGETSIPWLLAMFGVGAALGLSVGGRLADRFPLPNLYVGLSSLVVVLLAMAVLADSKVAALVGVSLLGFAGFAVNPALNARVFGLAEGTPTLAGSINVSAFNVGNTIGPAAGGAAITAGLGYGAVPVVSAVIAACAVAVSALSGWLDRAPTRGSQLELETAQPGTGGRSERAKAGQA